MAHIGDDGDDSVPAGQRPSDRGSRTGNISSASTDDRTVIETVQLDTRWSFGFVFPRTGDTAPANAFAFLTDRQPGNCPGGTTAVTYKITATVARLALTSYVDAIASGTYCPHHRAHMERGRPGANIRGVARMMVLRRALTMVATMVLAIGGHGVASAAPATPTRLYLADYSISVIGPTAPAHNCDNFGWDCGYVAITASFGGLNRLTTRPYYSEGAMHLRLMGKVQVSRTYGCQDASGKRQRSYDQTVTESVALDNRRGIGFPIPPVGDTVGSATFGYLPDRQPGNCPAGTTAMTYRIVAKQARLDLNSYVDQIASRAYRAPGSCQWIGAVPVPDHVLMP